MKFASGFYKFSLLIILFFNNSFTAQNKPIKVLFVGNSFTYYHNLPQVVSAMAKSQGYTINTRHSTIGGATLEDHWKSKRGVQTRKMIENEHWDYVVFNNHSLSAIKTPKYFIKYSKKFADLIKKKGAEPIFMMTWAYKSNPLMLLEIEKMYQKLSVLTKTDFVPCGSLFAASLHYRPDLELFHDDKHPSQNGTYLLGLSFYKYFIGKKITYIPENVSTLDKNGQRLYLLFTNPKDANFMKKLVAEFPYKLRDYKK
ncbi:hypothetical protein K8354_18040 [Polaribacter litorisediminis]|uniref:DUF4886 domain-containing protein n=1 Tax=Polaribacter litorisediminis TaxID=1908341 RepID=UPI001CBB3E2F|nr:DUF4886 domain-containing protein [Polaribacter litorisediminis]UAM98152.1 hypothetical protein K8354_18040 [Polaribacter litorisediminis]